MSLHIFNTLTSKKEHFEPLVPGKAGMYVCGVTVYDECHLGHARAYVSFDIMQRYLKFCGYDVTYVRNVTDVDDKIIQKAQQEGRPAEEITARYYEEFRGQMKALGMEDPACEPRATKHLDEMKQLVADLLAKGVAYRAGGDIFFEVAKFPAYGRLSRRPLEEMEAGARVEVNANKKSPLDFVLWKAAKPGEPSWESPWGPGRPGWHLECSAMSMKYLGETFDVHGGGQDLIFPHHENEIAQSGASTGEPLARYWVHNGFVMFKSHKMSKSLGNVFTLARLFEIASPDTVKMFLLGKHYRSPVDFDPAELEESKKTLEKIENTLGMARKKLAEAGAKPLPVAKPSRGDWEGDAMMEDFCAAMDDDFNTPRAMAVLHALTAKINAGAPKSAPEAGALQKDVSRLETMMLVLGVPHKPFVLQSVTGDAALSLQQEQALLAKATLQDQDILMLVEARNHARRGKDFARSDRLRDALKARGIELRDEGKGSTTWVRAKAD